ncbi:MAG: ABC transporter permease [Gemmatimonadota bacterium]|jgi:predicted permease
MDLAWPRLRQAARRLARAPLFTVVAVATLAVGIGANTAIFSVVNGVLLEPLPYESPDRLVDLSFTAPGLDFDQVPQSPATYLTFRSDSRLLEDMAAWSSTAGSVTGLDEPEEVPAMRVTEAFFSLLGVEPAAGRLFDATDDAPDAPFRVVLGYEYWQRTFGGDPDAVGRTLTVGGDPAEIIGVAPAGFGLRGQSPDLFWTARWDPAEVFMGNFSYQGFGRLAPGADVASLEKELDALIPVATERFPGPLTLEALRDARVASVVVPLKDRVVGDVADVLWILLGGVGLVLLIACANVANLFLVRAEGRAREVAIRTALGAGWKRVAGDFLLESVVLGVVSGALGVALAWGGLELLLSMAPGEIPRLEEIGLEPTVLVFALALSVLSGLLFGLFPLLRFGRPELVSALKEGSRGTSQGRERHRARNALVAAQVAMAMVLLVGSGLMIRSFQALRNVDPGFDDPSTLMAFRVTVRGGTSDEALTKLRQIQDRLAAIPGVRSAAGASGMPLGDWQSNDPIVVEGFPFDPDKIPPIRRFKWLLPGYLETMGTPLLAGRSFTWTEIEDRADVAILSERVARDYFQNPREAVGRRVALALGEEPGVWREVIGVAADVHEDGVDQDATATVYWPAAQTHYYDQEDRIQRSMAFALRVEPAAMDGLLPELQEAVWGVDASLPLARVRTMEESMRRSLARTSFTLVLLGIAAAVALMLGSVGIYGVISYAVSQRTREIGVRMALGAERGQVSRMVVGQGMVVAGIGVVLGVAAALGLTRLMESLLFGVEPVDPLTFGAVAVGLSLVALLASWLPARRAAGLDPARTLHQE